MSVMVDYDAGVPSPGFPYFPDRIEDYKLDDPVPFGLLPQSIDFREEGDHMKKDYGKDPWHLLPYDAVRGIVKVLAFGANKYRPRGWEEGMDWSRCFGALQRHLVAWWNKEGVDKDTGYSHLWHAGCCILFLIAYELRGKGKDDRP